jgi:hypothetical protein
MQLDPEDVEWVRSEIRSLREEILADRAELSALKALLGIEAATPGRDDDHALPLH